MMRCPGLNDETLLGLLVRRDGGRFFSYECSHLVLLKVSTHFGFVPSAVGEHGRSTAELLPELFTSQRAS